MRKDLEFNYTNDRNKKQIYFNHKSIVIWFFGLSGSGKSSVCNEVEISLNKQNIKTLVLDGDKLRNGLNKDLKFNNEDRNENLRRVAEVGKIAMNSGLVVLCSFITPLNNQREMIENIIGKENILWIYLNTPLEICINRDPKNLYKKAINGDLINFTGISSEFEIPTIFDLELDFALSIQKNAKKTVNKILENIVK